MSERLIQFLRDDHAATAVEYAVMLGLILLAALAAIGTVGSQTGSLWTSIQAKTSAAGLGS